MKKTKKIAIWILVPIAVMFLLSPIARWFQRRYVPPNNIATVTEVLEWTGRPEWIMKYSSATQTYYEIAKKVPVVVSLITASSGPPSYTVDTKGRFVGWSPDSGEFQTPGVVWTQDMKKEQIDVDRFLEQSKQMTPNKALEATSEPAPSAGSSPPQG